MIQTVYIAGPMRGYKDFNFPPFARASAELRSRGYRVLSPAEIDVAYGFDPERDPATPELVRQCVRRDVEALCQVDAVVMLPYWQGSRGASAERAIALWLHMPVFELVEFAGPEVDALVRQAMVPALRCGDST